MKVYKIQRKVTTGASEHVGLTLVGVFLDLNEDQQYELTSLKLNNTKRLHPAVCSDKESHIRGMYLPEIFIVACSSRVKGTFANTQIPHTTDTRTMEKIEFVNENLS